MKAREQERMWEERFREEADKIRIRPARDTWRRIDRKMDPMRHSGIRPGRRNLLIAAGFILLLGMTFALGFHSGRQKATDISLVAQRQFRVIDLDIQPDQYSISYHDAMEEWLRYAHQHGLRPADASEVVR